MSVYDQVRQIARQSQAASRVMRGAGSPNRLLETIAGLLETNTERILAANERDMQQAKANEMPPGLQDRLQLTPERVQALADAVRDIAALPSPIGQTLWGRTMENGLRIEQIRVPLGVVAMIYEARPNVTVDAAALSLKTNNAVILRGGSAAVHSNRTLVDVIQRALEQQGLPRDTVQTLDGLGREAVEAILTQRGLVDLAIPRGGAGLIEMVVNTATVPVIETGVGNCHIYVDQSAKLDDALRIVINAKTQRVGVCNAAETLLVDCGIAPAFLPLVLPALAANQVRLHTDQATRTVASQHPETEQIDLVPATEKDWETEYLDYDLAVRLVDGVDAAIDHITRYSTGHTEAVIAQDQDVIDHFVNAVDAAAIAVNASTRFTDGAVFGLGAEIGISTQKLHARGPMGMEALTTTKSVIRGHGQVRS
ncbi:glutamate-5-semialdehyde dehydrogenase [Mobiluncus sp.]|uniref:glutamate-5-semialdehyde dehydrogenase n=1 Tax=Mobiluncus sp. TaxID=47293 RepID=UPI002A909BF5|nr:glutamate-5-semialdehyde dehydrogenase [Mobiluncus sp.]MDY6077402.1 glutamate-5-semialdehyde dehydrogenase [Mobiluncus sp.]